MHRRPLVTTASLRLSVVWALVAGVVVWLTANLVPTHHAATTTWRLDEDSARMLELDITEYRDAAAAIDALWRPVTDPNGDTAGLGQAPGLRSSVRARVVEAGGGAGPTLLVTLTRRSEDEVARLAAGLRVALESWDAAHVASRKAARIDALTAQISRVNEDVRVLQVLGPSASVDALDEALQERDAFAAELARVAAVVPASGAIVHAGVVHGRAAPGAITWAVGVTVGVFGVSLLLSRRPSRDARVSSFAEHGDAWILTDPIATFGAMGDAEARSSDRTAADLVRESLLNRFGEARTLVLLVTSPAPNERTTAVACEIAESFARANVHTLLVDANLRAPSVAGRYAIHRTNADGDRAEADETIDWLTGSNDNHRVWRVVLDDESVLDVIPQHAPVPMSPGGALRVFNGFRDAVDVWGRYRVVVVDTAAILEDVDTRALATNATATLLVLDHGRSDVRSAVATRAVLDAFGADLAGVVTTPPGP